jgi:predicted Zn-dependent protease
VAGLLLAGLACSNGGPTEVPPPTEFVEWAAGNLGFSLRYPSDWNVQEAEDLVVITHPDDIAQLSLGWREIAPGQGIAELANLLTSVVLSDLTDTTVVPIEQANPGTVELTLTGVDSQGIRWIHHFVLTSGGDRALVVQTIARADVSEAVQPVFESVLTSLVTIEQ